MNKMKFFSHQSPVGGKPRFTDRARRRETVVDEAYIDYEERPAAAPEALPEAEPEAEPMVMVTEDRTVRIPQYVTKPERHYVTKIVRVPSTRTVFEPVTKVVRREVPYEVRCFDERQILVPISPLVVPKSLHAQPPGVELAPPVTTPPKATTPLETLPLPTVPTQ